jgi:hypothetical protein
MTMMMTTTTTMMMKEQEWGIYTLPLNQLEGGIKNED